MEVFKITLESCLEDLKKLDIGFERTGALIKLKGILFLWDVDTWGILEAPYESVKRGFIPTPGYFRKTYCRDNWKAKYLKEAYDSMVGILKEEKFDLVYYTDVEEI